MTIAAYLLPSSGPEATPPASSIVSSFNVSGAACRSTAGARTCRFAARVPIGLDAVIVNLYKQKTVLVDNAFLAASIGPTPASASFRAGGAPASLSVVAPVLGRAGDFRVAVTPIAADGSVILNNNAASHIVVRVYAPAGAVTGSNTTAGVPSATIGGDGVSAGFHYSGVAFANAMTVTAVRGTSSITGQIFSARTPPPRACAKLADTDASRVSQTSPVTKGVLPQGIDRRRSANHDDAQYRILPSRSLNDTLAFYRRLGFDGTIHSHGDYAILVRETVELHFFTHRELCPAESSAGCYIRVADVDSVYRAFALAELPRRGIPRQDGLEAKPWGMREFAIVDPDGNLLRIGQPLEPIRPG